MHREYPVTFCVANQNLILAANGLERPKRWNGMEANFDTAGILGPQTAITILDDASSPAGAITGSPYLAFVRFMDAAGNVSNVSPASNLIPSLTAKMIVYQNVAIPTDTKVVRRQILRNTSGQVTVLYVDIDTADLTSTQFTSNTDDAMLIAAGNPVTISDTDGSTLVNRFDIPPNNKAVFISHLSRIFGAVEVVYDKGHIVINNGSTLVTGINTRWTAEMTGRNIYVFGAPQPFTIASVNVAAQTLTLTTAYTGSSELVAIYAIRPTSDNQRSIVYSEAGLPEAWPPTNSLVLNYTGDEITGLISKSTFVYILERRHVHKMAYQTDPADDGTVSLVAYRGCLNQRCWQSVDNVLFLLDGQGIWAFDGQGGADAKSTKVQEIFRPDSVGAKINWKESKWFHSSHDRAGETLRWFVVLQGTDYPQHAICYNYRQDRWWIEEYPITITASTLARVSGTSEALRGLFGGEYERFYLSEFGHFDNLLPIGTVSGKVANPSGVLATSITLTDYTADFDSGVVGAQVSIVAGKGKGQSRIVVAATPTTLTIRDPWLITPDATSEYHIGGVPWKWRSGPLALVIGEQWQNQDFWLRFEPSEGTIDLQIFLNRNESPETMGVTLTQQDQNVRTQKGLPDIQFDLSQDDGFHYYRRITGLIEGYTHGERLITLDLSGVARTKPVRVHSVAIGGVLNG
jgi:hypothetical protein